MDRLSKPEIPTSPPKITRIPRDQWRVKQLRDLDTQRSPADTQDVSKAREEEIENNRSPQELNWPDGVELRVLIARKQEQQHPRLGQHSNCVYSGPSAEVCAGLSIGDEAPLG